MQPTHLTMSDGAQIAVYLALRADAPTVVFSNSLGTDRRMWDAQAAALGDRFSVLRYDTRGHGLSTKASGETTIARLALDVIEICDALDLARVHFCGLSLGGMTGQWLGRTAPERLSSLVLAATSAYMGPPAGWQDRIELVHASGMAAMAERSPLTWFTTSFREQAPEVVALVRDRLLTIDPEGYAACCAAIRDMDQRGDVAAIGVPTLVVSGLDDPATSPDHGQFLTSQIPGARMVTLPGAHLLNIETPEFTEVIDSFFMGQRAHQ
jgi:3-oxoadipate enol-lactonase